MTGAHPDPPRPRVSRVGPILISLVVLVVLLGSTVLVWDRLNATARDEAEDRFVGRVDRSARVVESEIGEYAATLRDLGAYVTTESPVSQAGFASYVRSSGLFDRLPAVVGVLYLSRVPDAELDAFAARERTANPDFALFEIGPVGATDQHYVLTQYAPGRVDLQLPIGTDTTAIPTIAEVIGRSADTGNAVAASFQLDPTIQRLADRNQFPMIEALLGLDFFVGIPVYAPGVENPGPPNEPVGWVAATIGDFGDVAQLATSAIADDLGLELTVSLDGLTESDDPALSRVAAIEGTAGPRSAGAFETTRTVSIDGVDWTLTMWSNPAAADPPASSAIALAAGIAGSLLAAGFVYVRLRSRDRERAHLVEMAEREEFQREILDSVTNPMVVIDGTGTIVLTNPAWDERWRAPVTVGAAGASHPSEASGIGLDYVEVVGRIAADGHRRLADAVAEVLDRANGVDEVEVEVAVRRPEHDPDGELTGAPAAELESERWYAVRATALLGRRPGAIVTHTDITERRRSLAELEVQAARDTLTGLVNRRTFLDRLEATLTAARHDGHHLAVLFIDLDGFKPVNDTFGHAVGDEVLRAVARRIEAVVRSTDTAARLGGDEFVVLIDPLPDPRVAEASADRILAAMASPIHTLDHEVVLGASIGIAVVTGSSEESAAAVLHLADAAMYESKQRGSTRTTVVAGDGGSVASGDPSAS